MKFSTRDVSSARSVPNSNRELAAIPVLGEYTAAAFDGARHLPLTILETFTGAGRRVEEEPAFKAICRLEGELARHFAERLVHSPATYAPPAASTGG